MTYPDALSSWVSTQLNQASVTLLAIAGDASLRRYFRVSGQDGTPYVVMDSPPAIEDPAPFVALAGQLADAGIHTPRVLAADLAQGYVLLSDLGTRHYQDELTPATAPALYRDACRALIQMQTTVDARALPAFDSEMQHREIALCPTWFITQHLGVTLSAVQQAQWDRAVASLVTHIETLPRYFVHRDYHCRNLMVAEPNPGVLDFQGAVYGPLAYDLVSLLKDAYLDWPEADVLDWAIRYWQDARAAGLAVPSAFDDFYRDFEWIGVQRHLKVLGIFARLHYRDGKTHYLAEIPRVHQYVLAACQRYGALRPIGKILNEVAGVSTTVGYTF